MAYIDYMDLSVPGLRKAVKLPHSLILNVLAHSLFQYKDAVLSV